MIVVDASAALSALLHAGAARRALAEESLHVPHLVDAELASGLRRLVYARDLTNDAGWAALDAWRHLGVTRHSSLLLLERVWGLRYNLSAYDATYVALAELLGCTLLTADVALGGAPGPRCPITLVPS